MITSHVTLQTCGVLGTFLKEICYPNLRNELCKLGRQILSCHFAVLTQITIQKVRISEIIDFKNTTAGKKRTKVSL